MTPSQIELARHALGLPNKQHKSYRNYFVAGNGHSDYVEWMEMVQQGNARRLGDDVFWLTVKGALLVLKPREKLDEEDFPPGDAKSE